MKIEDIQEAIEQGKRVRLLYASGIGQHAEGKIIGYSIAPVVYIETDKGDQIAWRHDMAELVEVDTRPKCPTCDRNAEPDESRFCPKHQDHMLVCAFDHCIECGAFT